MDLLPTLKKSSGLQSEYKNWIQAGATEVIYTAIFGMLNCDEKILIPTPIFPDYIPITILEGVR